VSSSADQGGDGSVETFRARIRAVLEREVCPYLDEWERAAAMPYRQLLRSLAAAGLLGIGAAEADGGLGLDDRHCLVWAQELGRAPAGAVAMALSVQTDIAAPLLARGSAQLRAEHLSPAISGERTLAYAVSEAGGGSDPANIRTTARPVGDGWLLNGSKSWITNGSLADSIVLVCRTEDTGSVADLSLVVVPGEASGLSQHRIERKLGMRACDHGGLELRNVVVPAGNLLGEPGDGFELMSEAFTRERWFLAAAACAQARRIIAGTAGWAAGHRLSRQSLFDQQSVRFDFAQLTSRLEVTEAYVEAASATGSLQANLRSASVMKLQATAVLRAAADWSLQLHGARAYMDDDRGPARDLRDARASSLAGGSDEMLTDLIARWGSR